MLKLGDVLMLERAEHVVVMVNDCRALLVPVRQREVRIETRFGKSATFSAPQRGVSVTANPSDVVIERRLGLKGLLDMLGVQTVCALNSKIARQLKNETKGQNSMTTNATVKPIHDQTAVIAKNVSAYTSAPAGSAKAKAPSGGGSGISKSEENKVDRLTARPVKGAAKSAKKVAGNGKVSYAGRPDFIANLIKRGAKKFDDVLTKTKERYPGSSKSRVREIFDREIKSK